MTETISIPLTPVQLAQALLAHGLERLSDEQVEMISNQPSTVAAHLPGPVGLALFHLVEVPVPLGYVGLPPRQGKDALRHEIAQRILRAGLQGTSL